jgi:3-dehydroquinate synthase
MRWSAQKLNRDATVLALGGGVVGDIAGFAAACYQRGVATCRCRPRCWRRWIPPSAARPASITGRQEPDRRVPPAACVIADTDTLATPAAARAARRARRGDQVRLHLGSGCSTGWRPTSRAAGARPEALAHAIYRSCEIKAQVVARTSARRASCARSEFRPHLRPCHRGGDRLRAICTARRWRSAC